MTSKQLAGLPQRRNSGRHAPAGHKQQYKSVPDVCAIKAYPIKSYRDTGRSLQQPGEAVRAHTHTHSTHTAQPAPHTPHRSKCKPLTSRLRRQHCRRHAASSTQRQHRGCVLLRGQHVCHHLLVDDAIHVEAAGVLLHMLLRACGACGGASGASAVSEWHAAMNMCTPARAAAGLRAWPGEGGRLRSVAGDVFRWQESCCTGCTGCCRAAGPVRCGLGKCCRH